MNSLIKQRSIEVSRNDISQSLYRTSNAFHNLESNGIELSRLENALWQLITDYFESIK